MDIMSLVKIFLEKRVQTREQIKTRVIIIFLVKIYWK